MPEIMEQPKEKTKEVLPCDDHCNVCEQCRMHQDYLAKQLKDGKIESPVKFQERIDQEKK